MNCDNSQMNGVNLRLASLKGASLRSCNLRHAIMAGTDLEVGPSLGVGVGKLIFFFCPFDLRPLVEINLCFWAFVSSHVPLEV